MNLLPYSQWHNNNNVFSQHNSNSQVEPKGRLVKTSNCDYGCPCNFSGFPSNGFCRALVLYHIQNGSYEQDTNLDGLDAIYGLLA